MAVIRGPIPADNFTIIDNCWLRDPRLSLKAKGLLAYIASHRAGYRLTTDQMIEESRDGRDSIRAGLSELAEAGYLARVAVREAGRISHYDYEVRAPESVGFAGAGKSNAGKPVAGDDLPEQDISAGEAGDGKAGAGEPAPKKNTSQKTREDQPSSRARAPRATRVPDDFMPDDSMRAWYREQGIGHLIDGAAEHERFMDYWRAQPGVRGQKVDWPATWRNWMRRAAERPQNGRPATARGAGYQSAQERSREALSTEADLARIAEAYLEHIGGNPEDPAQVRPLVDELKRHPEGVEKLLGAIRSGNGSASRTPVTYSGSKDVIDGEVSAGSREVTSYATERDTGASR